MRVFLQTETGNLTARWSEVGQRAQYKLGWMQEMPKIQGSYLAPVPDFASHSPFGGASWFLPNPADLFSNRSADSN
jgi:hypothetical protein